MKQKEFEVTVFFRGEPYSFEYGSQAYIFHAGLYNELHENYPMETLLRYTELVHSCYLSDDNHTPLGALADYVAEHWEEVKDKGEREILTGFYEL